MSEPTTLRIGAYEAAEEGRGWTLRFHTGKQGKLKDGTPGEEIVRTIGYYSDLEHALRSLLREELRGLGAVDASCVLAAIESAYSGIRAAVAS